MLSEINVIWYRGVEIHEAFCAGSKGYWVQGEHKGSVYCPSLEQAYAYVRRTLGEAEIPGATEGSDGVSPNKR